jgi:hypothetical protein
MLILCDIDGVLSHMSPDRFACLKETPKNWDLFYKLSFWDKPNLPMIRMLRRFEVDHEIIYITGRKESVREITQVWLNYYRLPEGNLRMREEGDICPAVVLKKKIVQDIRFLKGIDPKETFAIDDEPDICAMYRELGFTVWEYSDLRIKE